MAHPLLILGQSIRAASKRDKFSTWEQDSSWGWRNVLPISSAAASLQETTKIIIIILKISARRKWELSLRHLPGPTAEPSPGVRVPQPPQSTVGSAAPPSWPWGNTWGGDADHQLQCQNSLGAARGTSPLCSAAALSWEKPVLVPCSNMRAQQ